MRVAALYDIHGNLPALDAVLTAVRDADVTHLVIGGDVLPGPMPRETIARLQALDRPTFFIHGNGDREVLTARRGEPNLALPAEVRALIAWNAAVLGPEHDVLLGGWPPTVSLDIAGLGPVLFCHATPRNDTEIFTRLTPETSLGPVFAGVSERLVVCGHTHMTFDRQVGDIRVVNAGSVGMPYGPAGAHWLLLGPDVQPMHTLYDLEAAAITLAASGAPDVAGFAERYVVHPPAEAVMLPMIEGAAIR